MQHITAILSKDIPAEKYPVTFPDIPCITVTFHEVHELPCKTTVETLFSTDEGVAFLLRCPEGTIYHAGDLNDWVWEGEPDEENQQMTAKYQQEITRLQERLQETQPLDVAFVTLDPRQEKYYADGMLYFLNTIPAKRVYPMHYWGQPEIIDEFLTEYPKYTNTVIR